jgi:hypothetical protein
MRLTRVLLVVLVATAHLHKNHAFLEYQAEGQQLQQSEIVENEHPDQQRQGRKRWFKSVANNARLFAGGLVLVQEHVDLRGTIAAAATAAAHYGEYLHICIASFRSLREGNAVCHRLHMLHLC